MINNAFVADEIKLTEELNEEQKEAVLNPINTCTKIVAGAGTGKTKIISKRYIKLVRDLEKKNELNPLEHILVITFTEKAANQMKERIFKELRENGIKYFGQQDWISTIHGFCSKILRTHSIEANLSPSFKMGDEKFLKEIYEQILKKIKYGEYLTINDIDKISAELGIESSILSIESLNRFNKINSLENVLEDIFSIIKKVKSLGKMPKEFMEKSIISIKNLTKTIQTLPLDLADKAEFATNWEQHLKSYISKDCNFYTIEENTKGISYKGVYTDILKMAFSNMRSPDAKKWNRLEDFSECLEEITEVEILMTKVIALIYALYQNELEKQDIVDFDDLINKTLFILENNVEIKKYYQNYFKHIIVDEFQDTNGAQLRLLVDLLPEDAPNITFVGDKKQSIYGFRYAQMENLDLLHSKIERKYNKNYTPISLKINYRSTPQVLEMVNHVTLNDLILPEEVLSPNPKKDFQNIPDSTKTSVLTGFKNSNDYKICEAKYIANEIVKYKKEYNLKYKNFAVLVKSHSQAEIIESELLKYGIFSIKKNDLSYFKKDTVKNIKSILKFAHNIRDEHSLVRILSIRFSDREIYELKKALHKIFSSKEIKNKNINDLILKLIDEKRIEELEINNTMTDYLYNLFNTNEDIQSEIKSSNLLQIFYKLLQNIPPYYNLSGMLKAFAEQDIAVFTKIITGFTDVANYVSLKTLNEYIELIENDKNFELPDVIKPDINAVQLLTIHASKGLEFPYIFVTNFSEKSPSDKTNIKFDLRTDDEENGFGIIIKSYNGKENPKAVIYNKLWYTPKEKAQQKRLFYVAVSRAERFLNILNGNKPAQYIVDMPFQTSPIEVNKVEVEKQTLKNFDFDFDLTKNDNKFTKTSNLKSLQDYKISFSQINTYSHCKNKFLLKYKYGYPEISEENNTSLYSGSILHNLIYYSYQNKKSFDNVNALIKDIPVEKTKKIEALYQNFKNSNYSPEKIKEYISEYHFTYKYNNVVFTGDIDLIVKNKNGTISIIDFKTNENIEKNLSDYAKQLYIYKVALENQGYQVNETKLLNLKENETKEINIENKILENAKQEITTDIENILKCYTEAQLNSNIGEYCKNCGYNYICR